MQRDVHTQGEHEVPEGAFITGFHKPVRQPPPVNSRHYKSFLPAVLLDVIAQFGFHKRRRFSFQGILQAGAVHYRRYFDKSYHLLDRIKPVPFAVHHQAQVRTADAEGIHLAVEFLIFKRRGFHISIGADALDADLLTQQIDGDRLIALGRPDADADCTFHIGILLLGFCDGSIHPTIWYCVEISCINARHVWRTFS